MIRKKSTKKVEIREEPSPIIESPKESDLSKVEPRTSTEVSKEVELIYLLEKHDEPKKIEKVDEPKKDEPPKEARCEFRDRCFICNEVGHMKRDCRGKSFKTYY